MKLKTLGLIAILITISGCSVKLTPEARMVREIQPDWKNKCKFLGVEEVSNGEGMGVKDDIRNAKNMMRNKVAQRNGNAYLINDRLTNGFSTEIQFEIYKCHEK